MVYGLAKGRVVGKVRKHQDCQVSSTLLTVGGTKLWGGICPECGMAMAMATTKVGLEMVMEGA